MVCFVFSVWARKCLVDQIIYSEWNLLEWFKRIEDTTHTETSAGKINDQFLTK